jgi:hypothetical protein
MERGRFGVWRSRPPRQNEGGPSRPRVAEVGRRWFEGVATDASVIVKGLKWQAPLECSRAELGERRIRRAVGARTSRAR